MYELRTEDIAFLQSAPVVHVFEGDVQAPRAAVFAEICDVQAWKRWFPGFRGGTYDGDSPGVGTRRTIRLPFARIEEHIVAWDEDERYAYAVDRTSVPMGHALVESWDLAGIDSGTRVRWTFAIEPRWPMRLTAPLAPAAMGALFRSALSRLEAGLHSRRA